MRRRTAVSILLSAGLLAAAPDQAVAKPPFPEPDQSPDPRGLTISGIGVARVEAPRRLSERSIDRAIAAARPKAYARAVADARRRARDLARAAGLDLGAVQAVRGRNRDVELGGASPRRHCRRRCIAPRFTAATASVTFATAQTSAAVPAGRALVVDGGASMPVRPRNRRNDGSIRAALAAARLAAAPRALAAARHEADALAEAAGLAAVASPPAASGAVVPVVPGAASLAAGAPGPAPGLAGAAAGSAPGALFAIAEVPRPAWELAGTFGDGRYCGMVRRRIVRRDPVTGRRRAARRVRQRRCFYPRDATVAVRVTYLPAP